MKSLEDVSLSELRARRPDLIQSIESKARAQASRLRKKVGPEELEEAFLRHLERGRVRIAPMGSEDDEAEEADRPVSQEARRVELVESYKRMGLSGREAEMAAKMEEAFARFAPKKRPSANLRQHGNAGSAREKMEEAFARFGIRRDDGDDTTV